MPKLGLGIPMGGTHSQAWEALQKNPGPLEEQSESVLQLVTGPGVDWSCTHTLLALHEYPKLQLPQFKVAEHPSEIVPQFLP